MSTSIYTGLHWQPTLFPDTDCAHPDIRYPIAAAAPDPREVPLDQPNLDACRLSDQETETFLALQRALHEDQKAKQIDIDLSKKRFLKNLAFFALSGLTFTAALMVTVGTGGAAAPLAALTGASLLLSGCDAFCAFKHWQNKKNGRGGLPMEDDCIANIVHKLATACHANDRTARIASKVTSISLRVCLAAAAGIEGLLLPKLSGAVGMVSGILGSARSALGEGAANLSSAVHLHYADCINTALRRRLLELKIAAASGASKNRQLDVLIEKMDLYFSTRDSESDIVGLTNEQREELLSIIQRIMAEHTAAITASIERLGEPFSMSDNMLSIG